MKQTSIRLIPAVVLALPLHASASVALFPNATSIPPGDGTCDGQAIVVSNCTVTVDGQIDANDNNPEPFTLATKEHSL